MKNWFRNRAVDLSYIVESIDFNGFLKNVENFSFTFSGLRKLQHINFKGCKFDKTVNWHGTFLNTTSLSSLNCIEGFELIYQSKPIEVSKMFCGSSISYFDLSKWTNLSSAKDAHQMFAHSKLKVLNLSGIKFDINLDTTNWTAGCKGYQLIADETEFPKSKRPPHPTTRPRRNKMKQLTSETNSDDNPIKPTKPVEPIEPIIKPVQPICVKPTSFVYTVLFATGAIAFALLRFII